LPLRRDLISFFDLSKCLSLNLPDLQPPRPGWAGVFQDPQLLLARRVCLVEAIRPVLGTERLISKQSRPKPQLVGGAVAVNKLLGLTHEFEDLFVHHLASKPRLASRTAGNHPGNVEQLECFEKTNVGWTVASPQR